jgi:cytochrome c oxidase assembly factor CtaG
MTTWLREWPIDPWIVVSLLITLGLYARGWESLRRRQHGRVTTGSALAFLGGVAAIAVALSSPLDDLSGALLQAHMTQHLLLMMVAPPLIWLGLPQAPILRGLPRPIALSAVRLFSRRQFRRIGQLVGHPALTWSVFMASLWAWHAPALFELALRSHAWHHVEHACFFGAGLLFWWPVIQPWPSHAVWPAWAMIPYLALADFQNTVLSAILTFADRVIYPTYAAVPRLWGISALDDQATAGVIMWIPGSIAFLVPLGWLVARQLAPHPAHRSQESLHGEP